MSSYKHKKKTHERGRERRSVLLFRFWNDAVCPGGEWDICACEGGPSFCRVRVMTGVRFAMVGTRAQRGNTLSNRRRYRSRLSSLRSTGDILVRSLSSGTLHFWGVGRFCVHIKRKHSASNVPALDVRRAAGAGNVLLPDRNLWPGTIHRSHTYSYGLLWPVTGFIAYGCSTIDMAWGWFCFCNVKGCL